MRRFAQLAARCSVLVGMVALLAIAPGCGKARVKQAQPADQEKFLALVDHYADEYLRQDNDLKRSNVARQLKAEVGQVLPDGVMRNWVGTVDKLGTTSEGKAYIYIELSKRASAITWNNAISDLVHHTLIEPSDPLYAHLAELNEGDPVVFTGKVLAEGSMTELGAMQEPEIIVRFADIRSLDTAGSELAVAEGSSAEQGSAGKAAWDAAQPTAQQQLEPSQLEEARQISSGTTPPRAEAEVEKPARVSKPRSAATEPAREAAPAPKQEKKLTCEERRALWTEQGKPEWLIQESLQSLGCR